MPVGTSESRIYLTVAYGKLRLKCDQKDEKAVWREYEGKGSWAKEFSWIEGKITKIFYKESADYGNSYEVNIWDGVDRYNISFKENSRYCHDFLVKLPNIKLDQTVKITPYSMMVEDKEKRGTSIQQNGVKIQNFFAAKVDDKWIYNHNFPEPSSDKLNEKQWKKYLLDMQIFLQDYIQEFIIKPFNEKAFKEDLEAAVSIEEQTPVVDDEQYYKANGAGKDSDDDLPF